jgi:tRNA(Ile)-lysidine synthase
VAFGPERLATSLGTCLEPLGTRPAALVVALSGGLDSTALLAALVDCGADRRFELRATHVDHGLHVDSRAWARHCAALAVSLGVDFESVAVDAGAAHGESPEAAARAARYAALAGRLPPGGVLLTAHHADDQLETILLQWLRGGGLRAVAGMPAVAPFAQGWHARPLLDFTRGELEAWAGLRGLSWLVDPSNRDLRFDRNYLRHEVLPSIRRRWPAAARTVARLAARAAEASDMVADVAAADLAGAAEGDTLSLARLGELPPARQRGVLRAWLGVQGLPAPAAATLAALVHDVAVAATDRIPCTNWNGARVYRYRGRLHAVTPESAHACLPEGPWVPDRAYGLGALGRLELRPATGAGLSQARMPGAIEVARREDGARFRPAGSPRDRALGRWFQEHGVLPWRRAQVPLLVARGRIIAVADLACDAAFAAEPGEPSWVVTWTGRPPLTEQEAIAGRRSA